MNGHLETAAMACACFEAITARQRAGKLVPDWMRALEKKLQADSEWHEALSRIAGDLVDVDVPDLSAHGPSMAADAPNLGKKITATDAAEILECSRRHVTRIATDLDGRKIGGHWMFDLATVCEYRDAKEEGKRYAA
jgi:hypothetical protein